MRGSCLGFSILPNLLVPEVKLGFGIFWCRKLSWDLVDWVRQEKISIMSGTLPKCRLFWEIETRAAVSDRCYMLAGIEVLRVEQRRSQEELKTRVLASSNCRKGRLMCSEKGVGMEVNVKHG